MHQQTFSLWSSWITTFSLCSMRDDIIIIAENHLKKTEKKKVILQILQKKDFSAKTRSHRPIVHHSLSFWNRFDLLPYIQLWIYLHKLFCVPWHTHTRFVFLRKKGTIFCVSLGHFIVQPFPRFASHTRNKIKDAAAASFFLFLSLSLLWIHYFSVFFLLFSSTVCFRSLRVYIIYIKSFICCTHFSILSFVMLFRK